MKVIKKVLQRIGAEPGTITRAAVKNALWQFLANITMKIGGLLFTVIIARILMPELFGVYGLVLALVGMTLTLADAGINSTLIRFASFYIGKRKKQMVKNYTTFLYKIKVLLIFFFSVVLIAIAFPLQRFFNKPISHALICGSLYLITFGLSGFFFSMFDALNKFKYRFIQQAIFQPLRVIFATLAALLALKHAPQYVVASIILAVSIAIIIPCLYLSSIIKRRYSFMLPTIEANTKAVKRKEIYKFIMSLSFVGLSSIVFSQIDTIMLGRFVDAEWLGYYKSAFSLFFGVVGLLNVAGIFYPIFSRFATQKERLNLMLKKANLAAFLISIVGLLLLEIFAYPAIILLFGRNYLAALPILRIVSLLIFSSLIIPNYTSYFSAIKKPQTIAKLLFVSMLLNVVLNYIFITWLLYYSQQQATIGAAVATLLSRYFYLFVLVFMKNKEMCRYKLTEYKK